LHTLTQSDTFKTQHLCRIHDTPPLGRIDCRNKGNPVNKNTVIVGLAFAAACGAAQAQTKLHFSKPDLVAAAPGDAGSGSFNAALVSNQDTAANRATPTVAGAFSQVAAANGPGSVAVAAPGGGALSQTPVSPAPEPSTYMMLLAGLGLVAFIARRRQGR
jgi:hypothetical protein